MKNYESPTIEQAGGPGNEIEPQTVALTVFLWAGVVITVAESPVVVFLTTAGVTD